MVRSCAVCVLFLELATANFYLHSPKGSNNKLNEVSYSTVNYKRLFDSRNDHRGGYQVSPTIINENLLHLHHLQVGDNCFPACSNPMGGRREGTYDVSKVGAGGGTMEYYIGSVLPIQYTAKVCSTSDTIPYFEFSYLLCFT